VRLLRSLSILCIGFAAVSLAARASAQESLDPIVVIEVGGPLDQRSIDYIVGSIESEAAHAYILKIDSPGVSSGSLSPLFDAVLAAPAPVVAWVGPDPAVAYGGSAYLANHADIRSAAPGAAIGFLDPAVHRGDAEPPSVRTDEDGTDEVMISVEELAEAAVEVGMGGPDRIPGFVDRLDPALGQLIIDLDGTVVVRGGTEFALSTVETQTIDGQSVLVQNRPVKFVGPGLLDRFLRLGASPETAFAFLLFGLAFAVFEFYAAGSGLMAVVASLALILSGYGMATLPIWWPAVALVLGGVAVLVWGFVLNRVDWRAVVGTILVLAGGFTFTTARAQDPPAVWMVLIATAAAVVFIWYSLTTVVRGRFATPTVGRDEMLGRRCLVVETLDPVGVVVVDGARWRATADRGVEIGAGAPAAVVGVSGLVLEVDPVGPVPRREIP
jgi:membrane-bound serine protease (ClpP class)